MALTHEFIQSGQSFRYESLDGTQVGREMLSVVKTVHSWNPNNTVVGLLNALASNSPDRYRHMLQFSMHNNTALESHPGIDHDRPVSAYFTYNPYDQFVIIEWGRIDPSSQNAKLHDYLNAVIDTHERKRQGMRLCSGHFATMSDGHTKIVLLDALMGEKPIDTGSDWANMINTFHANNIAPITNDGYFIMPVF